MKRISLLFVWVLTGLIPVLFPGCSQAPRYEAYKVFEDNSWNRFDIVTFSFEIAGPEELDLYFTIEYNPEQVPDELRLNLTIQMPSGDERSADYEVELAEEKEGYEKVCKEEWCRLAVPIRKSLSINDPGQLLLEIENKYSRVELPGIREVGMLLKRSDQ
ncbi:MAG: hypothetical protein Kow00127_11770 [Bacteroidales bacterium]